MASKMLQRLVGSSVDKDVPALTDTAMEKEENGQPIGFTHVPSNSNPLAGDKLQFAGGLLFEFFVFDQISQNMITSPSLQDFCKRPVERTQQICETAVRLCRLATAFSQTEDRQRVRNAAQTVSHAMMRQELATVLQAMLSGCEDMDEGIVVLFFFCLDLSARILESERRDVRELMTWCKAGLDAALGPYVMAHGGWSKVGKSAADMVVTSFSVLSQLKSLLSH